MASHSDRKSDKATSSGNYNNTQPNLFKNRKVPKINEHFSFQKPVVVKIKLKKLQEDSQKQKYEFKKLVHFHDVFQKEKQNEYKNEYIGKICRLLNRKSNQKNYFLKRKEIEAKFGSKSQSKLKSSEGGEAVYLTGCLNKSEKENKFAFTYPGQFFIHSRDSNINTSESNSTMKSNDSSYDSKMDENVLQKQMFKKLDTKYNFFQMSDKNKTNLKHLPLKALTCTNTRNVNTPVISGYLNTSPLKEDGYGKHAHSPESIIKPYSYLKPKSNYINKNYFPHINRLNAFVKKDKPKLPNHKEVAFGSVSFKVQSPRTNYTVSHSKILKKHQIQEKVEEKNEERIQKIKRLLIDFEF